MIWLAVFLPIGKSFVFVNAAVPSQPFTFCAFPSRVIHTDTASTKGYQSSFQVSFQFIAAIRKTIEDVRKGGMSAVRTSLGLFVECRVWLGHLNAHGGEW